jgi:hypothetical protein
VGHPNAPLTPEGRQRLCERVDSGRPIAHVAAEAGISRRCLSKWYGRWQELPRRLKVKRFLLGLSEGPHGPHYFTSKGRPIAMATKQYRNVRTGRTGNVGDHAPGTVFSADPDDPQVQAWLASGAIEPVVEPVRLKVKDAVER